MSCKTFAPRAFAVCPIGVLVTFAAASAAGAQEADFLAELEPTPRMSARYGASLWALRLDVQAIAFRDYYPYYLLEQDYQDVGRLRVRPGLEMRRKKLRLRADLEYAGQLTRFGADTRDGTFALYQLFIELRAPKLRIRLGRQSARLGSRRFVTTMGGALPGVSFDGLRFVVGNPTIELEVLGAFVNVGRIRDTTRFGFETLLASTLKWQFVSSLRAEPYVYYRYDSQRIVSGPPANPTQQIFGATSTTMPGLRLVGEGSRGWTGDIEAFFQFGFEEQDDHFAYGARSDVKFVSERSWHPSAELGWSLGSGQDAERGLREPDSFFDFSLLYFGYTGLFGWANHVEGHLRLASQYATSTKQSLSLSIDGYLHALVTSAGPWTGGFGGNYAAAAPWAPRFMGAELNVTASWSPTPGVDFYIFYWGFTPGVGAEARGYDFSSYGAALFTDLAI